MHIFIGGIEVCLPTKSAYYSSNTSIAHVQFARTGTLSWPKSIRSAMRYPHLYGLFCRGRGSVSGSILGGSRLTFGIRDQPGIFK